MAFIQMKKTYFVFVFILIFLNTIIGLLLPNYTDFNMLFAGISFIISSIVLWFSINSNLTYGLKLGLGMLLSLTTLVRFLCALLSINSFENNFSLVIFGVIVAFELGVYILAKVLNKVLWTLFNQSTINLFSWVFLFLLEPRVL